MRQQLRLAESAGYICAGLPDASAVYILNQGTSECLHASNTETIPPGAPHPVNFEVYRHPLQGRQRQVGSVGHQHSRKWEVADQSGFRPRASRQQHAGDAPGAQISLYLSTKQQRPCRRVLDSCRSGTQDDDEFAFSGYFNLSSVRTEFGGSVRGGHHARGQGADLSGIRRVKGVLLLISVTSGGRRTPHSHRGRRRRGSSSCRRSRTS